MNIGKTSDWIEPKAIFTLELSFRSEKQPKPASTRHDGSVEFSILAGRGSFYFPEGFVEIRL